ncbi:MAG: DUF4331 domain-containing protein [Acidobacteria bacterium]|nr:DUF4331 domain-containing protein [Acidobacteriota bacterium]
MNPTAAASRRHRGRCDVRKLVSIAIALGVAASAIVPTTASSHREAPLISQDPLADNTDVYAFVSPERPDRVVLIANFIPLQFPSSGPNFWKFDDNVLYEIMIDNTGDAVEDITFQFRFRTEIRNPSTFLYNTGPVSSLDDPDLNVRQFYAVTRASGPRRTGTARRIADHVPVMPANVGVSSIRDYNGQLGSGVFAQEFDGIRLFAGPRDEGFYVDLGATFDLLRLRSLASGLGLPIDSLAGYNVHTIAIEVPITGVTRNGVRPASASDPNATIGVWSTASRMSTTTRAAGGESHGGDWVQVSRLGNPLVNEVVIPVGIKDVFNGLEPTGDGAALSFVTHPLLPPLMQALFEVRTPATPRSDLVTIFLTGIPGLNQIGTHPRPSEMLRLNTAIPPSPRPHRLGVLGGDLAGFPNGRRVGDDVVDIALQAMAGATPLTPEFVRTPNNRLGDGVDANDKEYLDVFPFLTVPHPGRDREQEPRLR